MQFLIETNKKIYEISELIKDVSFKEKLNDGCSKLEFSYVDNNIDIQNGSVVRFVYDNLKFYGYVFKHSTNTQKEVKVTAYDQLRYCKAKDTIICKGDTITTLVNKMCTYFNLKAGTLTDTVYKLATSVQDSKTWLDIIYLAIGDTLANSGKWFALRDEFGGISIRDIEQLKLNLVLGDESLCYDYDYEKSVDDNFYNIIKIASDNEKTGKRDVYIVKDSASMSKYGVLQYFETLDKNANKSQAISKANTLLRLYNRESETLSLKCLGDTNIRAGNSFYAQISGIDLNKRLIVRSVTHDFVPVHTMDLEVSL